ncbi:MAG TPA: hypothetical protein VGQ76_11750 [Thermoanaerobaculia bacterium]|nr:hypothetical protein [Thermoanaerobaculia bacterium]
MRFIVLAALVAFTLQSAPSADIGCHIDPNGVCHSGLDAGSSMDPNGNGTSG